MTDGTGHQAAIPLGLAAFYNETLNILVIDGEQFDHLAYLPVHGDAVMWYIAKGH